MENNNENYDELNNEIKMLHDNELIEPVVKTPTKSKRNKIITFSIIVFLASILWIVYWQTDYYIRISRMIQYKIDGKISINDSYYQGDLNWGSIDGNGVFVFNTGSSVKGVWSNNLLQGNGEGIYIDCGTYNGSFLNSEKSGKGEFIWTNGDKYTGEWKHDQIDGKGTLSFVNGDIYEGNFTNSARVGEGKFTWNDGSVYEGQWKNDTINGKGTVTFLNGETLNGIFVNNQFSSGDYTTETDYAKYVIKFSGGNITKVGISVKNGDVYDCEYSEGNLNGNGLITYKNKDTYSGNIENGLKSGQGTYTWTDGSEYVGQWANDKINGSGTYFYKDGLEAYKLEGNFVDNKPDGECLFYVNSYTYYSTNWENGKCIKITE